MKELFIQCRRLRECGLNRTPLNLDFLKVRLIFFFWPRGWLGLFTSYHLYEVLLSLAVIYARSTWSKSTLNYDIAEIEAQVRQLLDVKLGTSRMFGIPCNSKLP